MTDAKYLAEIKAREQADTPAPWNLEIKGNTVQSLSIVGICHGMKPNNADAAFISHARTDVPALIAEVERLTAENATLKKALELACNELKLSSVEKVFAPDYFIQQAQEQDGKK